MKHPLHALCPYFAMFPETFARRHIKRWTRKGDLVLDPYCGRGTTILEALLNQRRAVGLDLNPVAYCVSAAKARPSSLRVVRNRIAELQETYLATDRRDIEEERLLLPSFFRRAFYYETLRQILFLRGSLRWRNRPADRFIAALALGSLHGDVNGARSYFSNQMPRTISTKPGYSLRYWAANDMWPTKRDVFAIMLRMAKVRLAKGELPQVGQVALGDIRNARRLFPDVRAEAKAVITSPPYL